VAAARFTCLELAGGEIQSGTADLLGRHGRSAAKCDVEIRDDHLARRPRVPTQRRNREGHRGNHVIAGILAGRSDVRDGRRHVDRPGIGASSRVEVSDIASAGRNARNRAGGAHRVDAAAVLVGNVTGRATGAEQGNDSKGSEAELHVGKILTKAKSSERRS
jgi:hypothetical protein